MSDVSFLKEKPETTDLVLHIPGSKRLGLISVEAG
jgi:hypothetical protein